MADKKPVMIMVIALAGIFGLVFLVLLAWLFFAWLGANFFVGQTIYEHELTCRASSTCPAKHSRLL